MQRWRVQWREDGEPVHGVVEVVDLARRLARRGMVQTGVVHVADHTLEPGQHASGRHGLVWIVTCESVRIRWRKKPQRQRGAGGAGARAPTYTGLCGRAGWWSAPTPVSRRGRAARAPRQPAAPAEDGNTSLPSCFRRTGSCSRGRTRGKTSEATRLGC